MCIYSPMPHTLSYCALIGKCALIRSNTVCCDNKHNFSSSVQNVQGAFVVTLTSAWAFASHFKFRFCDGQGTIR